MVGQAVAVDVHEPGVGFGDTGTVSEGGAQARGNRPDSRTDIRRNGSPEAAGVGVGEAVGVPLQVAENDARLFIYAA